MVSKIEKFIQWNWNWIYAHIKENIIMWDSCTCKIVINTGSRTSRLGRSGVLRSHVSTSRENNSIFYNSHFYLNCLRNQPKGGAWSIRGLYIVMWSWKEVTHHQKLESLRYIFSADSIICVALQVFEQFYLTARTRQPVTCRCRKTRFYKKNKQNVYEC